MRRFKCFVTRASILFRGTLFEKYLVQNRFEEFRSMCQHYDAKYVEVSNGSIDMSDVQKSAYVAKLSDDSRSFPKWVQGLSDVREQAPNEWIPRSGTTWTPARSS